tara:strand:- start:448 stop:771 length:324 start_codon:yes stop_codon:yes gene_type:complete
MPKLSRKYNKRVEIWKTIQVPDGFGGYTNTTELQKTVWMNVITNAARRATEAGLTEPMNTVIFELRYRLGIDLEDTFFRYKDKEYVLQGVQNKNEMNVELVAYATLR